METTARVVARQGSRVKLACGSAGPCGDACLCAFRLLGRRVMPELELEAHRAPPDAACGDTLVLSIDDRSLLGAALAAYLPPLLGALLGAGLARWVATGEEAAAVLLALLGFALGLAAARRLLGAWRPEYRAWHPPA